MKNTPASRCSTIVSGFKVHTGLTPEQLDAVSLFNTPERFEIAALSVSTSSNSQKLINAGYARVKLSSLGEPVDGVVTNSQAINFNESTASWGTITHFVIYDSATVGEGNLLMYGTLSTPRSVETAKKN